MSSQIDQCAQCDRSSNGQCRTDRTGSIIAKFDNESNDQSCIRLARDPYTKDQLIQKYCNKNAYAHDPKCQCINAKELGLLDNDIQKILDDPKNKDWHSQPFAPTVCILKQCDPTAAYLTQDMKQAQAHCPPIIYCTTSNDHISVGPGGTFNEDIKQACGEGASVTVIDTFWSFVKQYPWVIAAFGLMIFLALVGIGVAIYQVRSGSGSQLSDQQQILLLMLRKKKEAAEKQALAQQVRQQVLSSISR